MNVELITKNATVDDLTDGDYRDIYEELRQRDGMSLSKLVDLLDSAYSKATWSKYEAGGLELNRTMRSELRVAVGRPALPALVPDVVRSGALEDAAVYAIGEFGVADVVVMVSESPVTLRVEGDGRVWVPSASEGDDSESHVTLVTSDVTKVTAKKRPGVRPSASDVQNRRKIALDVTWPEVVEAGLVALEEKRLAEYVDEDYRAWYGDRSVDEYDFAGSDFAFDAAREAGRL